MQAKIKKILVFLLCFLFCFEQSGLAQVAAQLDIAGHLAGLRNAFAPDVFRPLHLRYLSYDPQANNFRLFLDKGSIKNPRPQEIEDTTKTLLHYFFIGLVLPNDKFWVNLKPDAEDNIIDTQLAQTDVGRVLLESDLQLKKDTARFTSPETPEGKEYWDKLYQKAGELFGSQNIIIPTLTRPWIMPDEIIIRETQDSAYIYKATLKVMLEQDYLKGSVAYNFKDERLKELNEYSSQLIRELIIPKLAKEINSSKRYAALRQVHYSLIMAQWFKARFANKDGLYSRIIDRGIIYPLLCSKESWSKTTYFKEYQKSFRDGEYKIQEPVYAPFGQTIRSYFSGGTDLNLGLQLPFGAAQEPQPQGVNILLDPAYRHPGPKSNETEQKIQATDVPGEVVIEFGRKDAATEENLPPYTGSGSTSIHKALQDARAMLDKGNFVQAKELLEELLKDLELAQKTGNIEALMSTWNERYPSDLPVDLLIADTPGAISEAQALLEQIEAPAGLPIQESVNSTKQEKGNFHTRLLNKLKIFLAALLAIAMIRSDTTITRNHHYQELTSTATIQAQGEHKNLLKVFSQFERWPGSKAHNSAARFIFTSLFDAGYFSQDADKGKPHVISNYVDGIGYCYIEGVLPGISKNARHIVVVAHFDSIGPGADDNASGVIGVLELAKRLIKGKSRDTVHFLFTGDEEFNKLGIRTFLRDMYLKGVTPENTIVINVDTIGYSHISGIGANLRPEIWLTPAYKSKDEGKHKLFPAIKLSPSPTNDSDEIVVAGEEAGMSDAGICALYGYPAVTISGITRKEAAELGIINTEYDNSSKINFEAMEKALSWLFKNLTRLSGWQYNPQSSKRKTASLEKPPAITEQEIDFSQQTQDLFRKNNLYFFLLPKVHQEK